MIKKEHPILKHPNLSIVEATEAHAVSLAPRLRKEDIDEINAEGLYDVNKALLYSVRNSAECYAVLLTRNEGEEPLPIALFGIGKRSYPFSVVWLLGSDELVQGRTAYIFLRHSLLWMDYFLNHYGPIGNSVYVKNTVHTRWLMWCGFDIVNGYLDPVTREVFFTHVKYPPHQKEERQVTAPSSCVLS